MTMPNEQELLNKPVAPIAEIPPTEISKASEQVAFEPATPEGVVGKKQEISLEGQAAMVKESLDKIKTSFVNWKQAILDSEIFPDDELTGVTQWFDDSFNRFQSVEQIVITELSLLQTLKSNLGEESVEMRKISERLSSVNNVLVEQQKNIQSSLTSLMTIREGLSQSPQAAKDGIVSSMKIVFKSMNGLSRKYLSSMDKAGLERDLSEEELLLKANNPEQFKEKMEEKKLNLDLLYGCYDNAGFSNIENSFVPADVYFEKETLFLTSPENDTLQSLILANGDLEKTRASGGPLIPENLRQFYMLKVVFEDSAERYQLLRTNFSGIESLMKILSVKKISSLDNYDLSQYTLSAFQSNIGRLLSENKAAEIPAYLQKNLNDLNNIIKYLEGVVEGEIEIAPKEDFPMPKIASVEVSDLDVPASAESKEVSASSEVLTELAPSSIVQGEIEVAPNADFALPKMASVELTEDEIMNADDLLEEVTKEKYKMPPSPAIEKTKLLESFWKAEDTFKQVVSRKVELGVSSDLKLIDKLKNFLIENGVLEVEGVSLSSPEFTIDFNSLQTELWSGINNLVASGMEAKKEFFEIESEVNKYISKKREGLVLLKEKLQKEVMLVEFRKQHPDVEQLMEVNINSKLVAKVNAIANLVKNQFLKAGIEEVDGINLLALSEIYDGGAAAMEFKNEARLITEQELAKGSSPEEVFAALNKFISRTDDKLRNLYKLLLENVPGRVVDRESQLVADFWKNQPGLANRVRYYETMFDELKKSADEKVGGSVSDGMSKKFRNNLNQSLKDALSQQKTEAEIIKLLEAEFKHADEIIDELSVDVFLKKDKPQPAEVNGGAGDVLLNEDKPQPAEENGGDGDVYQNIANAVEAESKEVKTWEQALELIGPELSKLLKERVDILLSANVYMPRIEKVTGEKFHALPESHYQRMVIDRLQGSNKESVETSMLDLLNFFDSEIKEISKRLDVVNAYERGATNDQLESLYLEKFLEPYVQERLDKNFNSFKSLSSLFLETHNLEKDDKKKRMLGVTFDSLVESMGVNFLFDKNQFDKVMNENIRKIISEGLNLKKSFSDISQLIKQYIDGDEESKKPSISNSFNNVAIELGRLFRDIMSKVNDKENVTKTFNWEKIDDSTILPDIILIIHRFLRAQGDFANGRITEEEYKEQETSAVIQFKERFSNPEFKKIFFASEKDRKDNFFSEARFNESLSKLLGEEFVYQSPASAVSSLENLEKEEDDSVISAEPAMETSKQAEQKSPENRELLWDGLISEAKSFDELAKIIQDNKIEIQGSDKLHKVDDLLQNINDAKSGKSLDSWEAPRKHGFREKLVKLVKEIGIQMGDENIIESERIKATPPPLPERMRKPKEQEPISLTEDMKKPVVETQKVAEAANWRQEAIVGPHERMLYISSLIKDLIKSRKNIDQKRELIDIDEKFNRLADSSDNPETMAAWEQFQADNNIETEDPLAYFVDEILDLNSIRKWREAKNDFRFSNAVDTANVRVSNFMNALGLSDGLLPRRRSSVDARASLKSGGGMKVQMPGSL